MSQATRLSILPGALSLIGRTTACSARFAGVSRGICPIGERTAERHGAAGVGGRHVIAGACGVQLAPEVGERDVLGRGRELAGANVRLEHERPRPEHAEEPSQRCEQCGRVGTRGFRTIPETPVPAHAGGGTVGPYIVCANLNACRKRWPKVPIDDE